MKERARFFPPCLSVDEERKKNLFVKRTIQTTNEVKEGNSKEKSIINWSLCGRKYVRLMNIV
jgi:hypothetical protein